MYYWSKKSIFPRFLSTLSPRTHTLTPLSLSLLFLRQHLHAFHWLTRLLALDQSASLIFQWNVDCHDGRIWKKMSLLVKRKRVTREEFEILTAKLRFCSVQSWNGKGRQTTSRIHCRRGAAARGTPSLMIQALTKNDFRDSAEQQLARGLPSFGFMHCMRRPFQFGFRCAFTNTRWVFGCSEHVLIGF